MHVDRTVSIITNGCSEAIKYCNILQRFFSQNHHDINTPYSRSALVIFYACGLTEKSRQNSIDIITMLKNKMNQQGNLIVWGCLPKIDPSNSRSYVAGHLSQWQNKKLAVTDRHGLGSQAVFMARIQD